MVPLLSTMSNSTRNSSINPHPTSNRQSSWHGFHCLTQCHLSSTCLTTAHAISLWRFLSGVQHISQLSPLRHNVFCHRLSLHSDFRPALFLYCGTSTPPTSGCIRDRLHHCRRHESSHGLHHSRRFLRIFRPLRIHRRWPYSNGARSATTRVNLLNSPTLRRWC